MSINSLQLVIRSVIPAIKPYISPLPLLKIYIHCNFSNCLICGEDTMPDVTKLKPIEISFYSKNNYEFATLEELFFQYYIVVVIVQ